MENKKSAGGCIVTKSVLYGKTRLRWLTRELPVVAADTGWRIFGDGDTQDYIDMGNMELIDFNRLEELEPIVKLIYDMPIGSEVELIWGDDEKYFLNLFTGEEIR
ncbi:MAG: DUF2185 domain-containing protein [Oscillospiraceae bacterium]|nr:DUF2185 domain-containing protein [Oscillospiraceae bacterium]